VARPKADDSKVRSRILTSAEKLFAARGYAGTAVRDIAREADVNGAMIHYYFGSKETLYHAIIQNAAVTVRGLIAQTAGGEGSTEQRLSGFVDAYAHYIFSHPNLARVLMREIMSGGQHFVKVAGPHVSANYQMLRELLEEGARAGDLRDIDLELAPLSLLGMVVVFQLLRPIINIVIGKRDYDEQFIHRLSKHTVDLFLRGAQNTRRRGKPSRAPRNSTASRTKVIA
jgi:AcrR family transcriptional regulator